MARVITIGNRPNASKLRDISIIVGCAVRTKIPASKNFHGAHGAPTLENILNLLPQFFVYPLLCRIVSFSGTFQLY